MELQTLLKTIVQSADSKHAENIKVLDVDQLTPMADYFVIVDAQSKRQVQAIANEVLVETQDAGFDKPSIEGFAEAEWILLSFSGVIVHIFQTESREFYQLERLWGDAEMVSVDQWVTLN